MLSNFYSDNASSLAQQYLSKSFEEVHQRWSQFSSIYTISINTTFPRWPNNDLWNLLSTDCKINNQKSDRLPTELKLIESKERIQHWWQEAWLNDSAETNKQTKTSSANTSKAKASSTKNQK